MARLVVRIRILPAEAESNLENVSESIKRSLPEGMELKSSLMEPIAFGLKAIVGDFLLDDAEGQMDKLEECIKSIEGVGEIEVTNISRQSVRMKQ
jgi:elongation factor 1-beta